MGRYLFKLLLALGCLSLLSGVGCKSTTDPATVPKDRVVSVQYIRVDPYDSSYGSNRATLKWSYPNYEGGVGMTLGDDQNTFNCGADIKTETKVVMRVQDWWKLNPCRRRLFIDGHELIFDGATDGSIEFIYHNDGTIEITDPQ